MNRILSALLFACASTAGLAAPIPKETEKLLPPTEKQLGASRNNLSMIGIAIHGYNDANGQTANSIVDKDGKALLSWRVQLLPYLEEEALYKQFKLDEPWDSKTNLSLSEKIPKVYAPIRVAGKKGETFYRGYNGPSTAFELGERLNIPRSFSDGTSNILAVVEAGEACIWSKPDDLPYDPKKLLPRLGGLFDGDFHVLMVDGSVHTGSSKKIDDEHFHLLITRNDGFVVDRAVALGHKKK